LSVGKKWLFWFFELGCVSGKTKCATCAVAEKQKNVRGAKIKSLRIGSYVAQHALFRSLLSACLYVPLSVTIAYNARQLCEGGTFSTNSRPDNCLQIYQKLSNEELSCRSRKTACCGAGII